MKETVLDVLMYLFDNYIEEEVDLTPDQESLKMQLRQAGFGDHQVAHVARELAAEMRELVALRGELADEFQDTPRVGGVNRFDHLAEQAHRNHAEQLPDAALLQLLSAGGDDLVEQGERVAQAAFRRLSKRAERTLVGLDLFLPTNVLQALEDFRVVEQAKREVLAARLNRGRELVRLRGRQDEK